MKTMHFVIFTGGLFKFSKTIETILQKADTIIAADSGAKHALENNYIPSVVLGDFDSLEQETMNELKQKQTIFITSPAEKDQTDTELAIQYAISHGATKISILGGIEGDRIDHILTNISLATNTLVPIQFMNGSTTAWVEKGEKEVRMNGNPGDLLSLIPLTQKVTHITTTNLQYPLENETLYLGTSRGTSNVFIENQPTVTFVTGILLFVQIKKIPYRKSHG